VALSMMSLAQLLTEGKGVAQDLTEARRWFQLAAEKGHEPAKARLAELTANLPALPLPPGSASPP